MFEKTVLRNSDNVGPISPGKLAEALLFYRAVHLVLDEASVLALVSAIGVAAFIDVLKRPDITSTYVTGTAAAMSTQVGPLTAHAFGFFSLAEVPQSSDGTSKAGRKIASPFDALQYHLERVGVRAKDAEKIVIAVRGRAALRPLAEKAFSNELLSKLAFDDLTDQEFLHEAVREILRSSLPAEHVPTEFKLRAQDSDLGFYLFGDLDFTKLEAIRNTKFPNARPVDVGQVLLGIFNARVDLMLASHYGGDFATSPLASALIGLRFSVMLERRKIHDRQIDHFQQVVLEEAPSLAESIDSGSRSFSEFLRLLDKAARFKNWAGGVHPDKGVVAAYLAESTKQDWIQGGPAKVIRYVIGAALGATGAPGAAETTWGLVDAFGLDKMFGGWRPNHFVEKGLKPFLGE